MTRVEPFLAKIPLGLQRYGLALSSVAVALGLSLFLYNNKFEGVEFPIFLIAVAVTVWYAGVGPAIVALVLASLAFNYYFTEPRYTFYINRSDFPYYVVFILFALLITWFAAVRRRVERNLVESRDELQREVAIRTQQANLLNLTHDTIFVRDMTDVITYWNRGAQELYGWSAEEAIGKRSHDLLRTIFPPPSENVPGNRAEPFNAELLRMGRWDGELRHTKANGTEVVVSSRWSLQRDERGNPVAVLETNNDISERKRREDEIRGLNQQLGRRSTELEGTNKELEAFAYSISHDLRAPLRHMVGYTELLQKHAAPTMDDKGRRYMMMILEAAKRMGTLIDDLLAFSRIGRAETRETMVSLDQLVKEVQSELLHDTEGRNLTWKVGTLPDLYGDRSMLKLVLVNLVSNAVKFTRTRPAPEIEIGSTDAKSDGVVVFVKDNGVGFDMKYVNKLFGVFQRLHRADEFEGTGIGLATVQRIVHRHGGRVWAEGHVGSGATFYLSLPKP
jgi:PAS domain S-box-containing protein